VTRGAPRNRSQEIVMTRFQKVKIVELSGMMIWLICRQRSSAGVSAV